VARRVATTLELPGGAIAHVGRSPKDNERVTFNAARPDDYWFHARGIPGAHVVLKLAHAGEAPTDEQIEMAAALAAGASRASNAAKVEVDYTQRKHVRRQGKGATGLVWYTDFKTVLVTPKGR
jgi:predicted ribosome quality control (RQC) complex YloA/Tae2 family protein